jgi:hypothetical protein
MLPRPLRCTVVGRPQLETVSSYREGGPQPFWEMKSNELVELNGSLAFHLVVRSPSDVETKGSVKLSCAWEDSDCYLETGLSPIIR